MEVSLINQLEGFSSTVCSVLGKISHLEPELQSFFGQRILTFVQTSIKVAANEI